MTRNESLDTMVLYDRSIIAADTAKEWLAPWGVTLGTIGLTPQHVEVGADWDTRLEVWEAGDTVAVYELATRLADHIDAPDVEYETNYGGTGKRVAALTQKAVRRLRLVQS